MQGGARVREDAQESKAAAAMTAITSNIFFKPRPVKVGWAKMRSLFQKPEA